MVVVEVEVAVEAWGLLQVEGEVAVTVVVAVAVTVQLLIYPIPHAKRFLRAQKNFSMETWNLVLVEPW